MSQAQTLANAPDLRVEFPRSPNATLGPYIILPRILDKCRAALAGTQGEYNYNCPLDQRFFQFAQVDAEAFKAEVAKGKSDEDMLAWVRQNGAAKSDEDILIWSYQTRWARPAEPAHIAYYESYRRQVAPNNPNVETWFQLLDTEEGRL